MSKSFSNWVENKTNMKTPERVCVIMRSISGGGKSFTAREMLKKYGGGDPNEHIFNTDDYFIWDIKQELQKKELAGEEIDHQFYDELMLDTYRKNWSGSRLRAAHKWNFDRFQAALNQWMTPLVVDNTNLSVWEMKNYVEAAEKAGYKIIIQEPTSPWWQDHVHMLSDKSRYGKELEEFAHFLAGYHEGMTKKYGVTGNTHGVPLDSIRNQIRRWQPNIKTADDVMGRTDKKGH